MTIPIYVVDAFAERPFTGNPAAVCLLPAGGLGSGAMQRIAAEMNLSETAFVARADSEVWDLRWFTPLAEVDLCGHATLAAAHLLWELGLVGRDASIAFRTRASGVLTCHLALHGIVEASDESATDPLIAMDFPAVPASAADPPAGLIHALGVRAVAVARTRDDWIVEVASAAEVRAAQPDTAALREVEARGVALTALDAGGPQDIVSRFFAPRVGIAEDPVTGSAHCALAPYYRGRLGRDAIDALQASPRGGRLRVVCRGDRVDLVGRAVTVLRGELVGEAVDMR